MVIIDTTFLKETENLFSGIFVDNNTKIRRAFFKEPLIQTLWSKFRLAKGSEISDYIASIDVDQHGNKINREKFLQGISDMEYQTDFHILPSI